MSDEQAALRDAYGDIARRGAAPDADPYSLGMGYDSGELEAAPDGANLGLGCGNPLTLVEVREGDVVVDLGSGGGLDCFLAARRVGPGGRVIGVDMTPAMLELARRNAAAGGGFDNVEFRHGDLQNLPVDDQSVDLVMSNCVISLVPDRARVYREAFRVLRPGGRVAVFDTLVTADLPPGLRSGPAARLACIAPQGSPGEYVALVETAGFTGVRVVQQAPMPGEVAFEPEVVERLTGDFGIPPEAVQAAARSMLSIGLVAHKPR